MVVSMDTNLWSKAKNLPPFTLCHRNQLFLEQGMKGDKLSRRGLFNLSLFANHQFFHQLIYVASRPPILFYLIVHQFHGGYPFIVLFAHFNSISQKQKQKQKPFFSFQRLKKTPLKTFLMSSSIIQHDHVYKFLVFPSPSVTIKLS